MTDKAERGLAGAFWRAVAAFIGRRNWRQISCNGVALTFATLLAFMLLARPATPWQALAVCLLMAAAAGLLGNIDQFESIKGGPGGIAATVRRAETATDRLLILAEVLGRVLVEQMQGGRFVAGATAEVQDRNKAALLASLRTLGLSEVKIAEIDAADRTYAMLEYVNGISRNGGPQHGSPHRAAYDAIWDGFKGTLDRPSPDQLEAALLLAGPLELWRQELLTDYRTYFQTGHHRRPDVWARRDDWYKWVRDGIWPTAPVREA